MRGDEEGMANNWVVIINNVKGRGRLGFVEGAH